MISTRIQLLILVAMCVFVAVIVRLLALKKLDYKLGLAWMAVFVALAGLSLAPDLLGRIAAFLDIQVPVNMLFFFGFLFCAAILFSLSRRIATLQAQVRRLAQEAALDGADRPGKNAPSDSPR